MRTHLLAIYGYARLVDELGDAAAGDRLERLDALEAELHTVFGGGREPVHPLLARLVPTVRALDLPPGPFLALIEANRQDQVTSSYQSYDELLGYCALSANPVGELVLHVFGVATPERIVLSDAVCSALQLAEHWQDVAEDRACGRVYLPAEDMVRFGVREDDLDAARTGVALARLIAFEVERARALLVGGAPLVGTLRGAARVAVAGYVGGGRAALAAITASGCDVLAGPPQAPRRARIAETLRTYRRGA